MSAITEVDPLIPMIILVPSAMCILLIVGLIASEQEYSKLESDIPNMDCKELVRVHNQYDYWLDGENDLFDEWYQRITDLGCVNP